MIKCIMQVLDAALDGMRNAQSTFGRMTKGVGSASAERSDSVDLSAVAVRAARNQSQGSTQVMAGDEMRKKLLNTLA